MPISENRERVYNEIVKETMGEKHFYEVDEIKREQCSVCKYKSKNNCRLEIKAGRCINYEHKKME